MSENEFQIKIKEVRNGKLASGFNTPRPTEFNTTSLGMVPLGETMDPLGNGQEIIGSLWDEPQIYNQALVLSAKVSVSCLSVV